MDTVLRAIRARGTAGNRVLVGIAGPPGSGKSTIASTLQSQLGSQAAVLPMDGFHLDNATLEELGLLHRKGAPQTFDAAGFVRLVRALREQGSVLFPTFDRDNDRTVPHGGRIDGATRFVLIEGNYLLLRSAPWSDLEALLDLTLYLDVPRNVLKSRLVSRWRRHGLSAEQAEARAEGNDLKNMEIVQECSGRADFLVREDE